MASIQCVRPIFLVHSIDSLPGYRTIQIGNISADRSCLAGSRGLFDWVLEDVAVALDRSAFAMRRCYPIVASHSVGRPTIYVRKQNHALRISKGVGVDDG